MARILLTHTDINSGNPVYVVCNNVTIDYSKSNSGSPQANYSATTVPRRVSGNVDVPKYVLSCTLQETPSTINSYTVMTQSLLKQFFTKANDDSDPITLNINYDGTQWQSLQQISGSYLDEIPVTCSKLAPTISAQNKEGQKPSYTLTLEEVKKVV